MVLASWGIKGKMHTRERQQFIWWLNQWDNEHGPLHVCSQSLTQEMIECFGFGHIC